MDPDDREFMRELLLRHEKASNAMLARFEENTREHDRMLRDHDRMFEEHDRMFREHVEFMDEQFAHRKAIWKVFDLLYGGPEGAGT
jgi:hypothetical protein